MKLNPKNTVKALLTLIIMIAMASCNCSKNKEVFRHVVAFKFKPNVTLNQIDEIVAGFTDLQNKIPTIINFEGGKDISNENQHKGFTYLFTVSFKDETSRAIYQAHPAHQAFVTNLTPLLADVLVLDYEVK